MAIVSIDVETTGLGSASSFPRPDGVVQVGIAWRQGGRVHSWSDVCNPGEHFYAGRRADAALAINGISKESIANARPAAAVARDLWSRLWAIEGELGESVQLRAYNRRFDEGFLSEDPWLVPKARWGECIMELASRKYCGRMRLDAVMSRMGLEWPGRAHSAEADAHAALLVLEKLLDPA